ncbi:plasmid partitioning protein RepB (plasmid) [Methylocapsa polymorpha]|uniref:Plasmid partitioning protein RepB n=1 Tax=Methylocapsa polymorpha TaxID=3080828 RepID=A0ABZ0HXY4_9HYPH|nr:plasmid partitioning protein RepB [Methylocapsa sp. RX1]WOJ91652.1 plasmid partitioning protein RepB [Methylocapsa sp. RX1]
MGLDDEELTAVNSTSQNNTNCPAHPSSQPTLGARGAVGAMGRSLERISAEMDAAKALGEQIAAGHNVVELDTTLIDVSFVPDRMLASDEDHDALVNAIRQHGQQVPILVRPHPDALGRYQVAFGHRRLRALVELNRPVRAVVRHLSDEELVVAQGQENNARKNLSYLERAIFATTLEDRGFGRDIIMSALSVDKTELSRLISISRSIPRRVAEAIGPAPKTGRRRWIELIERIGDPPQDKTIDRILADPAFINAPSDDRFKILFGALASRAPSTAKPTVWANDDGKQVAHIERVGQRVILTVDDKMAPHFGDYLVDRLPELYRAFQQRKRE